MSEREVQESEDFLNSPENSGKSENDLLNDLEQEKDASKRSQIEQALEPWFNNGDGVIVEVDGATFTNEDYIYIQQLNEILTESIFLEE